MAVQKKTILHFIDRLGRGGAETLLVNTVKELKEYKNIIVIIGSDNRFKDELQCDELIKLNIKSVFLYWLAIFKLRKVIIKRQVDIVHTHLFWPNIISRFATPRKIPLLNSIHAFIANSLEYKIWYVRALEKLSFMYRRPIITAVAKGALTEYFSFLNVKSTQKFVNYTFADTSNFKYIERRECSSKNAIKIISVGALRPQKNYTYLIESFKYLKNKNVELHIYGSGPLEQDITKLIEENNLPIILKGEIKNIHSILCNYDFFTLSSTYEGFSIAVIEAMSMKIPMILSDIPSFREQCEGTAVYFNLKNFKDFSSKLLPLIDDNSKQKFLGEMAYKRANENFTLEKHIAKLKAVYEKSLKNIQTESTL